MPGEEGSHIGPERPAVGFDGDRGGGREGEEVVGIDGLHPLERARVDDHDAGGAWVEPRRCLGDRRRQKEKLCLA